MTPKTSLAPRPSRTLTPANDALRAAGLVANHYAAQNIFADYRARKARNTIARQDDDLKCFSDYLKDAGAPVDDLSNDPRAWSDMTWGLVKGFVQWQLQQGYSIGSINVRLSTVKTYAGLAHQSGALDAETIALIRSVKSFGYTEGKHVDELRASTRKGSKKIKAVKIEMDKVKELKAQPDTPQGRRDALLLALLLDLGLRVGEVCALRVSDVDLKAHQLTFYREKVGLTQTHRLNNGLLLAMRAYFDSGDALAAGPLLRASNKSGALTHAGMTRFGVMQRVRQLGLMIGIKGLSPHDCRHSWATRAAPHTPLERLKDAGGWSSLSMPARYIAAAAVANEGVNIDED